MKQKIFTLFLALAASVGTIFASVTIDGIEYYLNGTEHTAAVRSKSPEYSGEVIIPSSVNYNDQTYSVTSIGGHAFQYCTSLTTVSLPENLTSIGDYAFYDCTGLTSIAIPNSVTSIGSYAFWNVPNVSYSGSATGSPWEARSVNGFVDGWLVYSDNTKTNLLACSSAATGEIIIPNSVTSIGDYAFLNCEDLTAITLPNDVSSIGSSAFTYCYGLTSLSIPASVNTIGGEAFYNITNIVYHGSAKGSPWGARSVNGFVDGWLVYSDDTKANLLVCSYRATGEINIPNTVSSIGDYAFNRCASLTSVTIPNSVTSMGWDIFYGCSNLQKIEVDENNYTFFSVDGVLYTRAGYYGNSLLAMPCGFAGDYAMPADVYSIECQAIENVTALTSITFSKNFNTESAWCEPRFETCPNLQTVSFLCQDELSDNVTGVFPNSCTILNTTNTIIQLPDTTVFYGEYVDGEPVYKSGAHSVTHVSENTCDSIFKRNVTVIYSVEIDGIYYKYRTGGHASFEGWHQDYPNGLEVTYRGSSPEEYDEYSGNIVIPDSAIYNGEKLPVCYVNMEAFKCAPNIKSLIFKSKTPPYYDIKYTHLFLSVQVDKLDIYVPYGAMAAYKETFGECSQYSASGSYIGRFMPDFHVLNPSNVAIESNSTSATITFGNAEEQKHIASCGIVEGEEFGGNIAVYIGLTPNSTYSNVPFYIKTIEGDSDAIALSFSTTALELTTQECKPVSANAAILLAQTNMSESELSCGFEWKRNDAPAEMTPNKVFCPVANGTMAGRLKNLNDQVYYKYRAFYESAAGKMYYGDWKYIFTGDQAVEFDPILYTYAATAVTEHEATLKGYALEGAEDFTEQGFEYWAESRVKNNKPGLRFKAQLGEKQTVIATGISMKVTLTGLDQGTVYKYRTFAKVGNDTIRGSVMSFTTQGEWVAYTVTFLDKNGNVISTQQIEPGEDAVAPDAPEVDGFRFTGWDTDFTNVQSDLTVRAQYTEIVMVTLVVKSADEEMGTVKGGGEYAEGIKVKITAVPNEGYEFVMWNDGNTDNPRTVTAANKTYTAIFDEKSSKEANDEVNAENAVSQKVLRNGQLLILRDGAIFNAQGARVE